MTDTIGQELTQKSMTRWGWTGSLGRPEFGLHKNRAQFKDKVEFVESNTE